MTLCIAAICHHNNEPRIVLCSDWKVETSVAGAEIADKIRWVKDGWPALIAGTIARADELVSLYRAHLSTIELTEDSILSSFQIPPQRHKELIVNEFLEHSYGFSRDWFLNEGVSKLPADIVRDLQYQFAQVKLDAQLLIGGFVNGKPKICVVEEGIGGPPVRFEANFGAVGTGAVVASATLFRRKHQGIEVPLMRAIYHVYEAKLLAEVSPGVGEETSIDILQPDGRLLSLSDKGFNYIESKFQQFGPEDIGTRNRFGFKDDYLEPFKFDWTSQ